VGLDEALVRIAADSPSPSVGIHRLLNDLAIGPLDGPEAEPGWQPRALLLASGDHLCLSFVGEEEFGGDPMAVTLGRAFERGCNWLLRHGVTREASARRVMTRLDLARLRLGYPRVDLAFRRAEELDEMVADEVRRSSEVERLARRESTLRFLGRGAEVRRCERRRELVEAERAGIAKRRMARLLSNSRLLEL
jgi:hypothetical protein